MNWQGKVDDSLELFDPILGAHYVVHSTFSILYTYLLGFDLGLKGVISHQLTLPS